MNARVSKVILVVVGIVACVAGYLLARSSDEKEAAGSVAAAVGSVDGAGEAGNAVAGINPELLTELRKLAKYSRPHDRLTADDFPDILLSAHEADDYGATVALLKTWTRIDRDGMVDYFLLQDRFCLRNEDLSWQSFSHLILAWLVKDDPRAALEIALQFPRSSHYLREVFRAIGKKSPDLAVGMVLENLQIFAGQGLNLGKDGNTKLARALAQRNPLGTVEAGLLRGLYFGNDRNVPLEIWKSLDEETRARTVTAFMPKSDDGGDISGAIYDVMAIRIASGEVRNKRQIQQFFRTYARRMVEGVGIAASLDWIESNLGAVRGRTASSDLFVGALRWGMQREEVLAQFEDTVRARPEFAGLAGTIVSRGFRDDPAAALDWVAGLGLNSAGLSAATQLGNMWEKKSDDEILDALERLPTDQQGENFLRGVAQDRLRNLGTEGALRWSLDLPQGSADGVTSWLMGSWAREDQQAAGELIEGMDRDAPQRDVLFRGYAGQMLTLGDAERREWIGTLGPADLELARRVVDTSVWSEQRRDSLSADLSAE